MPGRESPSGGERGPRPRRSRSSSHLAAPSLASSLLPLESSPLFFLEDISLPLPGLPEPTDDVGDPEWRWAVGDGVLLAGPEPSGGT